MGVICLTLFLNRNAGGKIVDESIYLGNGSNGI